MNDKHPTLAQMTTAAVHDQVETALIGDLERLNWFRILDDDQKRRLNDVLHAEAVDRLQLEDVILLRLMVQLTTYEMRLERQKGELIKRQNWAQGIIVPGRNSIE